MIPPTQDGDHSVLCPAKTLASVVATRLPRGRVFFYLFDHLYAEDKAASVGMIKLGVNRSTWASHASELPFVFQPPVRVPFTPQELALSQAMQSYWGSFARSEDLVNNGSLPSPGWSWH